jgi:hypothetical protein
MLTGWSGWSTAKWALDNLPPFGRGVATLALANQETIRTTLVILGFALLVIGAFGPRILAWMRKKKERPLELTPVQAQPQTTVPSQDATQAVPRTEGQPSSQDDGNPEADAGSWAPPSEADAGPWRTASHSTGGRTRHRQHGDSIVLSARNLPQRFALERIVCVVEDPNGVVTSSTPGVNAAGAGSILYPFDDSPDLFDGDYVVRWIGNMFSHSLRLPPAATDEFTIRGGRLVR